MSASADDVTRAVADEAGRCLENCYAVIRHCADQLSEEQIWWRPESSLNSVGNLMLHLAGNLRQWIVAGLGETSDTRNRPAEFAADGGISKAELLQKLKQTVEEAQQILADATSEHMLAKRRIQGFDVSGWGAVFDSVPHFKGHTQEIVCLTRQQLGDDYQFHWKPQTPEEGAPTPQ